MTKPFTPFIRFESYIFLLAVLLFAGSGCKKSSSPAPVKAADIYVSGTITASNNVTVAAYWKNGVITLLEDGSVNSFATGIALNGHDVYVSGAITSATGKFIATVWKNGVATKLTDGTVGSEAEAITINGSDVYVAGYAANDIGSVSAVYWKNNVPVYLTGVSALAITINGGDIYVAGSSVNYTLSRGDLTTYWKNTVATALPDPLPGFNNGFANGIAVSGNDVYMVGNDGKGEFWKNGFAAPFSGGQDADPWAIALSGADIYIGGGGYGVNNVLVATIWKNGTAIQLSDGTSNAAAYAIVINGKNVYAAGYTTDKGNNAVPTLWKNSAAVSFLYKGYLTGIAIVHVQQ